MPTQPTGPSLPEKRQQWLKILNGADRHSVSNQLARIGWDFAAFAAINEARRIAPTDANGNARLHGLLHNLLDRGFFASQLLAIRCLSDKGRLEGERASWSLTGLLDELKKHHRLLTRVNIFQSEGLEYDYDAVQQRKLEFYDRRASDVLYVPAELNSKRILQRHRVISQLAGVKVDARRPEDPVRSIIFNNLKGRIERSCEKAGIYVNKFLAHAAAPEDRTANSADELSVTLATLKGAHQSFCEVAAFLSLYVLGDVHPNYVPIPQYDLWEHVQRPLARIFHAAE